MTSTVRVFMKNVVRGVVSITALGVLGSALLGMHFARRVITPARTPDAPVRVLSVNTRGERQTVTLSRDEDADLDGKFSFIFEGGAGHARLGPVIRADNVSVERELYGVQRGTLVSGVTGRVTGWWYADPNELGLEVENVAIPSPIGILPAWRIAAARAEAHAMAIHVHGRGARREETLRGVAPLARADYTNLVLSYRNDPGAPAASDKRYGLGHGESEDVIAAIDYAVQQGAKNIVLFGWSMGATASLLAAEASSHRALISGLILDSPGVDWPGILQHHARRAHLPAPIARYGGRLLRRGSRLIGLGNPIPLTELTPERFAAHLSVPTLIHSSDGDTFVPNTGALQLASLRSDLVTLHNVERGEHVKIWNGDPEGWEIVTETFARRLLPEGYPVRN